LVKIELAGALELSNVFALVGIFNLEVDSSSFKLLAAGRMVVGPDLASYNPTTGTISTSSPPILSISALGAIVINGSGVALDVDVDVDFNTDIGLDLSVSARVLVNTTGVTQQIRLPDRVFDFLNDQADAGGAAGALAAKLLDRLSICAGTSDVEERCYSIDGRAPDITNSVTINALLNGFGTVSYLTPAGPFVVAVIRGSFNFVNFASGSGVAGVGISSAGGSPRFQLYFDVFFQLGTAGITIDVGAHGLVDVDSTGILVDLAVEVNADITSLFHLDVAGRIQINTKGSNDYFRLDLSGRLDIGGVVNLSGAIIVVVDHGAWSITIPESNKLSGKFGPLSISGWGFVRSNGEFDINVSASVNLGVDGFGISGTVSAGASLTFLNPGYRFRFYLEGEVELEVFGIDFGASLELSGEAILSPTVNKLVLRIRACVDLGLWTECGSAKIAELQLPDDIFPDPPPRLAQYQFGDNGVLELNVGALASRRTVETATTAETYTVTPLSFDSATGYYTVRVEAFGYNEVFSKVTSITGDFGSDHDLFVLASGSAIPVVISGGDGNDLL
ncbi:MAG: hypothetical protein ACRDPR_18040, partial [Nocardioidaceae bacterium]